MFASLVLRRVTIRQEPVKDKTFDFFSGRICSVKGCDRIPADCCATHAPGGMANIYSRKCRIEGCAKKPSFGVAATKTAEYCATHASDGSGRYKDSEVL